MLCALVYCVLWDCACECSSQHLRSRAAQGVPPLRRSNRPHILNRDPPTNNPDPFLDASEQAQASSKVHIRVQQRNGRKCITTVAGLGEDLDVKRILKVSLCVCFVSMAVVRGVCVVFVCGGGWKVHHTQVE